MEKQPTNSSQRDYADHATALEGLFEIYTHGLFKAQPKHNCERDKRRCVERLPSALHKCWFFSFEYMANQL